MSQNTLSVAPDFNLHRGGVSAPDSGTPPVFLHGVNSRDYARAVVDVSNTGTLAEVTLEALFWSDASASFVSDTPPQTFTLSAAGQFTVETHGRRFFIKVNALSGTGCVLTLQAAGAVAHP